MPTFLALVATDYRTRHNACLDLWGYCMGVKIIKEAFTFVERGALGNPQPK